MAATEATRAAINSEAFLEQIRQASGWAVQLLSKEDEGKYGVMGVACSINETTKGLVIDMGGGSVQLTWMDRVSTGDIQLGPSRSFPYGAASLTSKLDADDGNTNPESLTETITSNLKAYFERLRGFIASSAESCSIRDLSLFVSGGGMRRFGYLLMANEKIQPYPIPIVNGYYVEGSKFELAVNDDIDMNAKSHRLSKRGHSQLPAVKFFLKAFLNAISSEIALPLSRITFCEGGVREGILYEYLPESVRAQDSLTHATISSAPPSSEALSTLISSALPKSGKHRHLIQAISNLLYYHAPYSRDIQAPAALRCTTSGFLANTHGLSHIDRAALALILCERWGGLKDTPSSDHEFFANLVRLLNQHDASLAWWTRYIGCVARGIATIYPAGVIRDQGGKGQVPLLDAIKVEEIPKSEDHHHGQLHVEIVVGNRDLEGVAGEWKHDLEKLGKKKHWRYDLGGDSDGKEGEKEDEEAWGLKIHVDLDYISS